MSSSASSSVFCAICQKHLSAKTDMSRHRQIHSPNKESLKHQCPVADCTYSTLQRSNLRSHMNVHTGEKPHTCPEADCDYRTADPGSLTRHRKRVHAYEPKRGAQGPRRRAGRKSARYTPYAAPASSDTDTDSSESAHSSLYLSSDASGSSTSLSSGSGSSLSLPDAPVSCGLSDADLYTMDSWFGEFSLSAPVIAESSVPSPHDPAAMDAWFKEVSRACAESTAYDFTPAFDGSNFLPAHMLDACGVAPPVSDAMDCDFWTWAAPAANPANSPALVDSPSQDESLWTFPQAPVLDDVEALFAEALASCDFTAAPVEPSAPTDLWNEWPQFLDDSSLFETPTAAC